MQPALNGTLDRKLQLGSGSARKPAVPQGGAAASPLWRRPSPPVYVGGIVVGSEHHVLNSTTAVVVDVRSDAEMTVALTADFTRIVVSLEEVGGAFVVSDDSPFRLGGRHARNAFSVIPAGVDARGHARKLRYMRQLSLQLDEGTLLDQFGDSVDVSGALGPRLMIGDARLLSVARVLAEDVMSAAPAGRLFTESLLLALLSLLAGLGRPDLEKCSSRCGLSPWRVRRATEYLNANMSTDVELGALAKLVGLSKSHFCREFKTATGLSPYQWLLHMRLERAKDLLSRGGPSIAEVALATGFADQPHFTRTFSKREGISPGAWAKSRLQIQELEGSPLAWPRGASPCSEAGSVATPYRAPRRGGTGQAPSYW